MLVDRALDALAHAADAAALNGVADRVRTRQGDAFEVLSELAAARERFDVVILDPPAFIRSKKDVGPGSRAYRKLVRLGASVTARRGYLFIASCSHNLTEEMFAEAVRRGLGDAGRPGRILATGSAGADHPVHPSLPESAYLKSNLLALD
jgi:23S rRNA (cytosine1962-C5)-methyltransferase